MEKSKKAAVKKDNSASAKNQKEQKDQKQALESKAENNDNNVVQDENQTKEVVTSEEEEPFTKQENEPEETATSEKVSPEIMPEYFVPQRNPIVLNHPFVLRDSALFSLIGDYYNNNPKLNEAKFYKKSEIEEFLIQHHKIIFGDNTVIIDNTNGNNEYFPDMFLIDFENKEKPRMYILEIHLQDDDLGLLYARITHFMASLTNKKYQNDFLTKIRNVIYASDKAKEDLGNWLTEEQELSSFLSGLLDNKPAVLLIKDNNNVVLDLMQTVYIQTWGKILRQILIRKFYCEDETIYDVNPLFANVWKNGKQKTEETIKVSENDHLCELPDRIRNIYKSIKTALLELDSSLEFNPKKHYISIRKNKNLAFLHLRRKQADIVIMNPEESTRELIKYHRIKTLPASVQKFWNGECCTIVVEHADNLEEVIGLLKLVVGKV